MLVVFCSSCGEELPEDANFCPKCGVRTSKGVEAGVTTPLRDLRDAFSRMGEELEKAFKRAREEFREATAGEPVVCSNCGEENFAYARFCYKCGKKLD